jgi:pre-mRNA-splicing factor ATP-dependent RNA helicase DHX38/PRP16
MSNIDTKNNFVLLPPEPMQGGLIKMAKRNPSANEHQFKMPEPVENSNHKEGLGLDKLAAAKKKEKNQQTSSQEPNSKRSKLYSYKIDDNEIEDVESKSVRREHYQDDNDRDKRRNYRDRDSKDDRHSSNTPHRIYNDQKSSKDKNYEKKGVYASTNKYGRDHRNYDKDRNNRSKRDHWEDETPGRRRDDYYNRTPSNVLKDTPSRSNWEDDDNESNRRNSNWDINTPKSRQGKHDMNTSSRHRLNDNTPRATPAHKYNKWADDRKRTGITPSNKKGESNKTPNTSTNKQKQENLSSDSDNSDFETEQQRLDREWYGMDESEGFDQENNSFASMNEKFLEEKSENLKQKWKRKVSFHQQQKNRDVDKWETNRMLQSGAISQVHPDEDFEEETEARVNIIVRHMFPPFLDGRITFTKQFEPVIPLKDPTSDMAIVSRKGCMSVRRYREQKERLQAAEKVNQLAGTKMGNILGIENKSDKEKVTEEDSVDYKKNQQFADHMITKTDAISDFARENTLKEQRQFLPVFAVKQEVTI